MDEEAKKPEEKNETELRDDEMLKKAMAEVKARYTHSKLNLVKPITGAEKTHESLTYDFANLTGKEYVQAMDSDRSNTQNNAISKEQALALFAISAAKESDGDLDKYDILGRIGAQDAIAAARIATSFFYMNFNSTDERIEKL